MRENPQMIEDKENKTAKKKPSLEFPPVCGVFVGRDQEIAKLMAFLKDQSQNACSIMLVYGPRGVGKSALIHEVARRSYYEQDLFETVVWLDRTRASELLLLNEGRVPLSEEKTSLDPNILRRAETHEYLQRFWSKREYALLEECASWQRQLAELKDNLRLIEERLSKFVTDTDPANIQIEKQKKHLERQIAGLEKRLETRCVEGQEVSSPSNGLPQGLTDFLGQMLKRHFLLIIDDFDEYEGLGGNDYGLCEQLARIKTPNKVILTTRLLEHNFSEQVYQTLPVGLLSEEETRELALQCGLADLKPYQLIDKNLDDTVEYLWKESGGLPEFITRFFVPIAQQRGWLIDIDPIWREAFKHFSAEYLGGQEQTKLATKYAEEYTANSEECAQKLAELSDEEKCILASLALQEEVRALNEEDLARSTGHRPEDEAHVFHKALTHLIEKRLILPRIERGEKPKERQSQEEVIWRYILLPFTRQFIKGHLFASSESEANLHRMQTDRWIHFVEGYTDSPHHIEHQFDIIHSFFDWCVLNQEWDRVVRLGKALGESLFRAGFHAEQPTRKKLLIEICQKTADAAQKPDIGEQGIAVDQWRLLAQFYSDADDSNSQRLALEYAKKALNCLEETRKEGTADDRKWADTACTVAQLSLQNKEIAEAEYWLGRVKENGGSEEWHLIAYEVAQLHLNEDQARMHLNEDQARNWLNKVTDAACVHGNFEIAIQAEIDLAYLSLRKGDLEQADSSIRRAKEMGNEASSTKAIVAQLVRATTIEAQVAYYSEDIEKCQALLGQAIDAAKGAKLQPVADRLDRWWSFLSFRSNRFDPAGEIDKILGAKLLWGAVDADLKCSVCKKKLVPEDWFEDRLWQCPNCDNYTHIRCLSVVDDACPHCQTPYSRD